MMRSLYSGVAGLKIHQTRMDVIGNNISNVNTVGFKSSSVNFSDTFYQTVSGASGPNNDQHIAGTNAKQIGLGGLVASITTNITENGGTTTTNRALDVAVNGESFLVVNVAGQQLFTKSGALNVDTAGNLYCTTNGGIVQGWMADDNGNIVQDIAQDLKVMTAEKTSAEPTATSYVTLMGNIDPNHKQLSPTIETGEDGTITPTESGSLPITAGGVPMTYSFYDKLGELYTVKLLVTQDEMASTGTAEGGEDVTANPVVAYTVRVADVYDSQGESIFVEKKVDPATGQTTYASTGALITFGSTGKQLGVQENFYTPVDAEGNPSGDVLPVNPSTGEFRLSYDLSEKLYFNSSTGGFARVGEVASPDAGDTSESGARKNQDYAGKCINFSVVQLNNTDGHSGEDSTFEQYSPALDNGGIELDFTTLTQFSKGGTSEVTYKRGDGDGNNAGNYAGTMSGLSVDERGVVYGKYTNGETKVLAQICVANFSNPSGLEAQGDSLFAASLNSGLFDGVGEEVSKTGSFSVGALEMSNVDLASEFTNMITTQRGFQANSRIITTSDSMLEELVNLKR